MLILTFISSDQDLIHIVTQTDCTFCGAACGNVIGGDDCVGVMVPGNLVTVTVPQGQEMTEDFKFPLVLILQSSWDIHSYIFSLQ